MRILWFFPTLIAAALLVGIACSDSLPTAPVSEAPARGTELEQAAAKLQMWLHGVESVELEIRSTVSHEDPHEPQPAIDVTAAALITADTFYFSVELPNNDAPGRPPWRYETLVQHGFAYARWQNIDGWAQRPLSLDARTYYGVIEPREIATTNWAQLDDVAAEGGRWRSRDVWVVEYHFSEEQLTRFPDLVSPIATGLNGAPTVAAVLIPDSARVRLWIDRDSGAPLRIETTQVITQSGSEEVTTIASTVELVRWNEPLAMPVAEPVVSEAEFWELVRAALCPECRYGHGDTQAWEVMELMEAWLAELRNVHYSQTTAITLHGERRSVTLELRIAGGAGAVEMHYSDGDGASTRMIWIGDDLWLAETPNEWFRATPEQAGVGDSANAAEWLDQTVFTEPELPLALGLLKGILPQAGWSSSPDGHEEVRLEAELSGRPLADLQEIAIPVVEQEIEGFVGPALRVERVDRLDVRVRVDPNTGELFDATVDAAASTSAGRLELEARFEIISHDDIRIDPPATD